LWKFYKPENSPLRGGCANCHNTLTQPKHRQGHAGCQQAAKPQKGHRAPAGGKIRRFLLLPKRKPKQSAHRVTLPIKTF
jgi:hypothetical protein